VFVRPLVVFVALLAVVAAVRFGVARGAVESASSDPCSLVASDEVDRFLGTEASPPDELSRRNGSCYYFSRSASEDGTLAFRIVRDADLDLVRHNYTAAKITCGGVAPQAPRYAECVVARKLASVASPAEYCAARSSTADAEPIVEGALKAVFADGSLFALRDDTCYEARVIRGDRPVHEAEIALLKLLVARAGERRT
jgi:hypothetical protein